MFFRQFPQLAYKIDDALITVTDIFRRVVPLEKFIVQESFLETYTLKAGERPEDLAFQLYGSAEYHWILLLINNIVDPFNEWYYTPEQLQVFVDQKYGKNEGNATHSWVMTTNTDIKVDYNAGKFSSGDIQELTHLQYEMSVNDARQEIKVLHPRYLNDFVAEFKQLIGQ
jgi:hypothetical protein|tara:strand:+ start:4098 stop:4607 length:510 start_codon:yes stop_codon:yes gene_type:complete